MLTYLLIGLFCQNLFGQNWREYPHPTIGRAKYIEFYKDSMMLLQNTDNQCFISFDLGSSWTLSMNGFAANDYPTYITLGKDQNFYAQIRDNIYKYSIKDNYWIWLFGGYYCNTWDEYEFQVDEAGNIYSYCYFMPANTYKPTSYFQNTGEKDYYPSKMIVLGKDKVIKYHSERGTINFVDRNGVLQSPINIIKDKKYLFYSEQYQNIYLYDDKHLFIININTLRTDSVALVSDKYTKTRMYENENHELLISGFRLPNKDKNLYYSTDGGFNFLPFDHFISNDHSTVEYLHFLAKDNLLIVNDGLILRSIDKQRNVDYLPGNAFTPTNFIKTKDREYFQFFNGAISFKLNQSQDYEKLLIDDNYEFHNMLKDNEGTAYMYCQKNNSLYYKLINSFDWIKVNYNELIRPNIQFLNDENGIIYTIDSLTISFSKDKGIHWNKLYEMSNLAPINRITSIENEFYFSIKDSLYIVDPTLFNIRTIPINVYIDVDKNKKILYYEAYYGVFEGVIKADYIYYWLDLLQPTPIPIDAPPSRLGYTKCNNSFWLFKRSGYYIINLLNAKYEYSTKDLPKNSSQNIYLLNIYVDDEGFLYVITDTGVFVYKDRVILQPTSTKEVNPGQQMMIFPNPATSYIDVTTKTPMESMEIINSDFKTVLRNVQKANSFQLDISDLPSGLYFLKCNNKSGQSYTAKFLKLD